MKSWKVYGSKKSELVELDTQRSKGEIKVKVTKVILSPSDVALWSGAELDTPVVPGRVAIGLISDAGEFDSYKIGQKVLITPYAPCGACPACLSGKPYACTDIAVYGLIRDGFLSNFAVADASCITEIPDDIAEDDVLLSEHIAIAINVTEKLNIKKGDYVAVFGSSLLSYILCSLCIYYHAVPIMISSDAKGLDFARANGIYYTIDTKKEDARAKIAEMTSGNLADVAAFDCDSLTSPKDLCAYVKNKAQICLFGFGATPQGAKIDLSPIVNDGHVVFGVNNGGREIPTAINLIVNSAINLSPIEKEHAGFSKIESVLESRPLPLSEKVSIVEIEK